jgi:TrmH family RNA methyltransferase
LAALNKIPLIENNEKIFQSQDKDNVMVIAEFEKFETPLDPKKNHVVLVHPSNMGNLGTIMRSCAAFQMGGLAIIRPAADAFDPKTIRSSMGAIFSLPFRLSTLLKIISRSRVTATSILSCSKRKKASGT